MKNVFYIVFLFGMQCFAQNSEKQVYLIHGYGGAPNLHWFKWLDNALSEKGIKTYQLTMPNTQKPQASEWLEQMKKDIKVNDQTIIVGHSLGCIATLNFLANTQQKVLGVVLVAGFSESLASLKELDSFSQMYKNRNASPQMLHSVVIAAMNDAVVPHHFTDKMAQELKSKYIRLPEGGHFVTGSGYTKFPLVLSEILEIFNKNN